MEDNEQKLIHMSKEFRKNIDLVSLIFQYTKDHAIIAADCDGSILAFNEGARQIYGYDPEELIDKQNIEIFFPSLFIETGKLQELIKELLDKERLTYQGEKIRKDGKSFPAQVLYTVIKNNNGNKIGFIEVTADITEYKNTEEALKKSEESYRNTIISNPNGIAIVDMDGRIRFVNPAAEVLFDRSAGELLGEIFGFPLLAGKTTTIDVVRKDGQIAIAEMRVAQVNWEREPAYLTSLRDITEIEKLHEQLIITDRLASIGQLASGVAHEINNPLTSVIGFSQMLLNNNPAADIKEDLQIINNEAQRAAQIVKGLLTFSRKGSNQKVPSDICKILIMYFIYVVMNRK
jgi:two-component system NtrC family sensor kinase